jgi:hypothetical protein
MWKLPSAAVEVPLFLDLTTMETPDIGSPDGLTIFPCTVMAGTCACRTAAHKKKKQAHSNLFIMAVYVMGIII